MLNSNNIYFIMAKSISEMAKLVENIDNNDLKALVVKIAKEDPEFESLTSLTGPELRYEFLKIQLKPKQLKNPDSIWVAKVAKKYDFYPKEINAALKMNEYKCEKNKKRCGIAACVIRIGDYDDKFIQEVQIFCKNNDDDRVAFAIVGIGKKLLFVQYLFVVPEHRKNGLCSMFIEELKDNLGDRTLILGTNNPVMLRLLHKRGFKCKGKMGDGSNRELEMHFKH